MIIRQYKDDDLESVVTLFTDTVRHINIRDYSSEQVAAWAPQPPDLARWRERLARLTLWVAELDGQVVGFCGLDADGHLDFLYTDYRFQRRCIGQRLYQHVETEARSRNIQRLFTEASITARPFFERNGFGVIREQDVELRGVLFRNYAMQKIVGGSGKQIVTMQTNT
jgi:putative acetyltransferase